MIWTLLKRIQWWWYQVPKDEQLRLQIEHYIEHQLGLDDSKVIACCFRGPDSDEVSYLCHSCAGPNGSAVWHGKRFKGLTVFGKDGFVCEDCGRTITTENAND